MELLNEKERRGLRIAAGIVAVLAGIECLIMGYMLYIMAFGLFGDAGLTGMVPTAVGLILGLAAAVLMAVIGFGKRYRPVPAGIAVLLTAISGVLVNWAAQPDTRIAAIIAAVALAVCALTVFRLIPWTVVAPIAAAVALAMMLFLPIRSGYADVQIEDLLKTVFSRQGFQVLVTAVMLSLGDVAVFLLSLLHWQPKPRTPREGEQA